MAHFDRCDIIKPEFPDYYSEGVQRDICAALDADVPTVHFEIIIERYFDGEALVSYIRPIDSLPICADRPHLSYRAQVAARLVGVGRWLLACDHAYVSAAHIVMSDADLARFGIVFARNHAGE